MMSTDNENTTDPKEDAALDETKDGPDDADGVMTENTSDGERQQTNKKRKLALIILIVLILGGALAAVLILVVFKPKQPIGYNEYIDDFISAMRGKRSFIGSLPLTSPQGKALRWLREDDGGSSVETTPHNLLLERYVMAVFFFATDGANWKDNANFLSDLSICDWWKDQKSAYLLCFQSPLVTDILFANHSLAGNIPTEIGLMQGLWRLLLPSNDEISGSIPTEIGELSLLTQLDLHGNKLQGKIPAELANTKILEYLELDDNSLTGSIPAQLGTLTKLTTLLLGNNDLTGGLPKEISNLVNLTEFTADSNRLSGRIPDGFNDLAKLHTMYLEENKLTGDLERLCSIVDANDSFTGGADCRSGRVNCSCCDDCYD